MHANAMCALCTCVCAVCLSHTREILPLASSQSADERERGVREREAVPLISGYPREQPGISKIIPFLIPARVPKAARTLILDEKIYLTFQVSTKTMTNAKFFKSVTNREISHYGR